MQFQILLLRSLQLLLFNCNVRDPGCISSSHNSYHHIGISLYLEQKVCKYRLLQYNSL